MKGWALGIILVPAMAVAARAQTILYSDDFDHGAPGWTFSNSGAAVGWAVDASPARVGSSDSFASAPFSLNYNNGIDLDDGGAHSGTADSPPIDLRGKTGPWFSFACNYDTEENGTTFDRRIVEVSNDGFRTTLLSEQLSGAPGSPVAGPCAAMGTWHTHVVPLDPRWGVIQIRFRFDSGDAIANTFAGWFIDDLVVDPETGKGNGATGFLPSCSAGASAHAGGRATLFALALLFAVAHAARRSAFAAR